MVIAQTSAKYLGAFKLLVAMAACAGAVACAGITLQRRPAEDVYAVEQVVEAFRMAILRKDKSSYMNLFFSAKPEDVGWQAVVDDTKLANIKRARPQAIKARAIPTNNFVALIDSVVASNRPAEERITNLMIDTDGETASASFDYAYLSDGQVTNTGREHWLLVRTESGWKIFSVVYTIRDPLP